MSLNESIVEDAALAWFGALGDAVGRGPHCARRTGGGAGFVWRGGAGAALARGHPAAESGPLATLRDTLLPKLLSGG